MMMASTISKQILFQNLGSQMLPGRMQAISRLGWSVATKAPVGVNQAADGNMREQFLHLKAMANDVGSQTSKRYLPKNLVWETLCTMIFPLIGYPLGSTTFTEAKSVLVTKSLYAQLLPSGGANQNYPTVYHHAPSMFFRLALLMVIETQFTKQVKKILTHGAIPTPIGEYLKVSLEQAQLEVGISTPILEASFDNYGCLLTPSWVKKLWEHHMETQCLPSVSRSGPPKLQREGDAFYYGKLGRITDIF